MISGVYTVLIVVMLITIRFFMVEEFVKRTGVVRFCIRLFDQIELDSGGPATSAQILPFHMIVDFSF